MTKAYLTPESGTDCDPCSGGSESSLHRISFSIVKKPTEAEFVGRHTKGFVFRFATSKREIQLCTLTNVRGVGRDGCQPSRQEREVLGKLTRISVIYTEEKSQKVTKELAASQPDRHHDSLKIDTILVKTEKKRTGTKG